MRFVQGIDGLEADPEARRSGRGSYLCPQAECAERALARRGFDRSLRSRVTLHEGAYRLMETWPRSASTR